MEANELRIGNYAMGNKPFAVDANHIAMAYNHEIAQNGHERFKSIPLTEDWLIRFGFEKDENNWYKLSICNDWTNLYWERLAGVELSVNKHSVMQPHIKYVHQLQNIYFALTGIELTLKN